MKNRPIKHQFVDAIPEKVEQGTLYISLDFATVVHRCECGCGLEVVTPLSPTDWKLIFDGVSVSLHPSIGNWSFPCRSHYWIRGGYVEWAGDMQNQKIADIRDADRKNKEDAVKRSPWYRRAFEWLYKFLS